MGRSQARNQQKLATTCENRYKCTCGLAFTSLASASKGRIPDSSHPLRPKAPALDLPERVSKEIFRNISVGDSGDMTTSGCHVQMQNVCKWMEKPPQSKIADKTRGWQDDAVAEKQKKKHNKYNKYNRKKRKKMPVTSKTSKKRKWKELTAKKRCACVTNNFIKSGGIFLRLFGEAAAWAAC